MSFETRLVTPRAGLHSAPAAANGLARSPEGTSGASGRSSTTGGWPRRRLLAGAGAVAGALALPGQVGAQALPGAAAQSGTSALAADAVYFEETGHTVS
ncbi:MAG: hypothetical protein M3442_16180, partial [Chloroflexota bacterium]|nr:hypothetical protein [Chloroflexota bacterium]